MFRIRIRPDPKLFGLKDPDPKLLISDPEHFWKNRIAHAPAF